MKTEKFRKFRKFWREKFLRKFRKKEENLGKKCPILEHFEAKATKLQIGQLWCSKFRQEERKKPLSWRQILG